MEVWSNHFACLIFFGEINIHKISSNFHKNKKEIKEKYTCVCYNCDTLGSKSSSLDTFLYKWGLASSRTLILGMPTPKGFINWKAWCKGYLDHEPTNTYITRHMKVMVLTLPFSSVRDLKLISHLLVKIRHLLLFMCRKNISTLF